MTMNLIESMIEKKQQQILLTEIKCYENWWDDLNVLLENKTKQNKRMMHDLICVGMPVNSLRITTFEMLFKTMKSMKIVLYFQNTHKL